MVVSILKHLKKWRIAVHVLFDNEYAPYRFAAQLYLERWA